MFEMCIGTFEYEYFCPMYTVMLFTCTHIQCRAGVGACPDTMDSSGTCTNDVTDVTGFVRDGQQCVAFTRPFTTSKSLVIIATADSL